MKQHGGGGAIWHLSGLGRQAGVRGGTEWVGGPDYGGPCKPDSDADI